MLSRVAVGQHQYFHPLNLGKRVLRAFPKELKYQDSAEYYEASWMGADMTFLVTIHKNPQSSYGISIPDLPGCVSSGETFEEAPVMAKQAIELHPEGMLDDDVELPEPSDDIAHLRQDPDYADALWGVVKVDLNWWRSSTSAA